MVKSVVIIELNSCRNSCVFCNPQGMRRIIDDNELKKIESHLLKQVLDLKKKGFKEVEISGCDPVEYSKISEFIRWLKDIGFEYVELSTHGRNLSDLKLTRKLRESGLDEVRIPLYGSNKRIHESVTQSKGSFQDTLNGIMNIKKYAPNIKIKITSLVMKQNYKDIENIFALASKYSSDIIFSIPCLNDEIDSKNIAVAFDEMKPYLLNLLNISKNSKAHLKITDIPLCVFGFYKDSIINITGPPVAAGTYNIPKKFRSDIPGIPSYRVKTRLKICDKCHASSKCDGFYRKYADLFRLDYLKPI